MTKVKIMLDGVTEIEVELPPELSAQLRKELMGGYSIGGVGIEDLPEEKEVTGL